MKAALRLFGIFTALLLFSACASHPQTSEVLSASQLRDALANDPGRDDADKVRDDGRRPAEVVTFLGIHSGMTVLDVFSGGGYYSEVLAHAVGPTGKVYAQNPARFGARFEQAFKTKFSGRLPNVEYLVEDLDGLSLPASSVDAAITALNFHDVYNRDPVAGFDFMKSVYNILKPGGIFGVVDHAGDDGVDNSSLHRVSEKATIETAKQAGFLLEATSDVLRHREDDHSQPTSGAERGYTDRFVLKLRKPG